jgi:hypothetical protein
VDHLIRWRILRRQSGAEGEYLLLHHDYLARGVREVQRQANRWVELLRERTREIEALGWRQRWRALLPLVAQARLFWARLGPVPLRRTPAARLLEHSTDLAGRRGRRWDHWVRLVVRPNWPAGSGGVGCRTVQFSPMGVRG